MEGLFGYIEEKRKEIQKSTANEQKNIGERHIIFGEIADKLNIHSYKKITKPFLGKLLSIYSTPQLYDLHSACKQANNYAALFWHFVHKKTT